MELYMNETDLLFHFIFVPISLTRLILNGLFLLCQLDPFSLFVRHQNLWFFHTLHTFSGKSIVF